MLLYGDQKDAVLQFSQTCDRKAWYFCHESYVDDRKGKLHPCCDRSQLIHKLADQVEIDMVEEQLDEAGADNPVRRQVNQQTYIAITHETCVL